MALLAITRKGKKQPKRKTTASTNINVARDKFTISEEAAHSIIAESKKKGLDKAILRVLIKGGGCSGVTICYTLVSEFKGNDVLFTEHNAQVCIDRKSFRILAGSLLNWYNELGKSGFCIVSPRLKRSCSCGESFDVDLSI